MQLLLLALQESIPGPLGMEGGEQVHPWGVLEGVWLFLSTVSILLPLKAGRKEGGRT